MKRVVRLVLPTLVVFSLAIPAAAQVSGIQGTIVDASKGVLPGVVVKATHIDTGTSQQTVTNAEGRYFFQGVRLGAYELTAELAGFATVRRTGVTVEVGQSPTIDIRMELAGVQETVSVAGGSPLVNLVESKIGGNLNIRQMEDTPLNG